MQQQYPLSRLSRVLVLAVVGILIIINPGCGQGDKDLVIEQLQKQLDQANAARDAANSLAAAQRGELQKSASEIADLQKQVMAGMCSPMLPFDDTRSFDCVDGVKYFPTGTFAISTKLTMQQGRCVMGLVVGGKPDVTSCPALDVGRAEIFRCGTWRCTLKP